MIPRLHVPLLEPEDVVRHLGKQERHWKEGRSAHALVSLWSKQSGFPPKVQAVLQSHPAFRSATLVDAFLERKVDLGSNGRPSQTDLLAVVGLENKIAILAVEGKAGEPFGDVVEQWLRGAGEQGERLDDQKDKRLEGLCEILGLSRDLAMGLRYQLLHRTASAILEAKRYRTDAAVLLVHSFSHDPKSFDDFGDFLRAMGFEPPIAGTLVGPVSRDGVSLYAGWVADEPLKGGRPYLDSLRDYADRLTRDCDRIRAWCDGRQSTR